MSYLWTAELAPGAEASEDDLAGAGVGKRFEDQATAEAWLGEYYEDLADLGVTSVSLFEEDRLVYGPMSLDEQ
ncbi:MULTISPECIES: hypothetical protein [unclassified Luteococcus]|uniref:hypothetical protein n=1 Tax=unclassified Luteococcus TaxID=2639923 RepID=UPI00313C1C91